MLNKIVYSNVTVFNLIVACLTIIVAIVIARVVSIYLRRLLKEKVAPEHADLINKVAYYCIIVIAVVSILPNIGVRASGLLVAGGVVGLAVGFASQSIIGNLISGIFLFIERPVKVGNGVNIDGVVGIVEDIRIMSTTLRGYDGLYIRLPNQKVFTSQITNFVTHIARRVDYVVGIRYSDDADQAIKIIKDLINEHPLVLMNPEPMVFVDNLGDNAMNIVVRAFTPTSEWFSVRMELLYRIKQALEKGGIEIAFPQRVVWYGADEKKSNAFSQETPAVPDTV
jgi:small-conductance mechanosensitive channel